MEDLGFHFLILSFRSPLSLPHLSVPHLSVPLLSLLLLTDIPATRYGDGG
ncbi:hypothetical protein KAU32_11245 [bacterium]|nr:hypothetical protein [bacterium]